MKNYINPETKLFCLNYHIAETLFNNKNVENIEFIRELEIDVEHEHKNLNILCYYPEYGDKLKHIIYKYDNKYFYSSLLKFSHTEDDENIDYDWTRGIEVLYNDNKIDDCKCFNFIHTYAKLTIVSKNTDEKDKIIYILYDNETKDEISKLALNKYVAREFSFFVDKFKTMKYNIQDKNIMMSRLKFDIAETLSRSIENEWKTDIQELIDMDIPVKFIPKYTNKLIKNKIHKMECLLVNHDLNALMDAIQELKRIF
jgi:hypothetical protein